jgi:DNA-binding NarL/FixJ family response regulator
MKPTVRVAILDDHQSIVDGYIYRLSSVPGIEVVATASCGEDLEPMLATHPTDVLILDVHAPTAPDNPNPYPILQLMPRLLQHYPDLAILVISMFTQRTLIQAVMHAGANGSIHLSQRAYQELLARSPNDLDLPLSGRQREVLSLSAAYPDASTGDLATRLNVANSTVRNLLSSAYLRLGVHNRAAAVAKARQLGLITPFPPAP